MKLRSISKHAEIEGKTVQAIYKQIKLKQIETITIDGIKLVIISE